MKVAAISGAVVAALAAGAVATPSFAQTYYDNCRHTEHNRGTAGAVIGGIAGAVIGSNIPRHHGARTGGAIIGGVAGAAIGNSIGRSSGKEACRGYTYYDPRYNNGYSTYNGYYDGRYGYNTYSYPSYNNGYYNNYNGYYDNGYSSYPY